MAKTLGLISRAKRVIALTGTPIPNRPIEAQPILAALDPKNFGSFFGFAKRYCNAHKNAFGWDFGGASNLPELQEKLRSTLMVRRLKAEVLKDLPAKRRQIITLTPNGAAKLIDSEHALYAGVDRLEADAELAEAAGDSVAYDAAVSELKNARRVAFQEMAGVRHDLAVAKIPSVIEHVDDMLESGTAKVLVFIHHHDVADALMAHWGNTAVAITGETPMDSRQQIVDRFQSDPNVKVFVGSITAAGVGITLTAASTVVFAELDWTPGNVTQAEDRAHRIGQTEMVLIQHLVFDGSLDARMAQILVAKQSVASAALDTIAKPVVIPVAPEAPASVQTVAVSVTAEQRASAKSAIMFLAARCDGAQAQDGCGFNKFDSHIGKSLAQWVGEFTDKQTVLALRLARKYQGQLSNNK